MIPNNTHHPGRAMRLWVLAVATLVGTGCRGKESGGPEGQKRPPVAVEVMTIDSGRVHAVQRYVGELRARESVALGARIGGRVRRIQVQLGDAVVPGEVLATLEDIDLRAQLDEAGAALELARASLMRAEVEAANAVSELERKQPLAAGGLITEQELDNVRTRRQGAAAQLAVARAQVSQAEAHTRLLQQQLAETKLTAPFAGRVAQRHLDPGAVVSPGTPILTLVQIDPVVARFRVPERDIGALRARFAGAHRAVRVEVDAYPGETHAGEIARLAPAVDVDSRTVVVEAELANGDGRLLSGMYCRVELVTDRTGETLRLPLSALIAGREPRDGEVEVEVFTVTAGQATIRRVEIGRRDPDWGEVITGLTAGDRVVVAGHSALTDGAAVNVVGGVKPEPEPTANPVEDSGAAGTTGERTAP